MNETNNLCENFPEYWEFNFATKNFIFSDGIKKILTPEINNSDITFEKLLQHVYSEDREYVAHSFEHFLSKQKTFLIDFRVSNQNNLIRHITLRGQAIFNDKNLPIKIKGFGLDNTTQKSNEKKLSLIWKISKCAEF